MECGCISRGVSSRCCDEDDFGCGQADPAQGGGRHRGHFGPGVRDHQFRVRAQSALLVDADLWHSAVAWFADQFQGRRGAVAAGLTFFVLGILSPMPVALFFLLAAVLCYLSFVDFDRGGKE